MTFDRIDIHDHRQADHPIEDLLLRRWSPRAMSGEAVDREQLLRLLEAARWAPSSYNHQPWRFLFAHRDTPEWDTFFDLLVEFNQGWCAAAGALLVIVSRTETDSGRPIRTHSFDSGAAWQNLALQGAAQGLVVHAMEGFDYDRAASELGVPDQGWAVEAMVAVGHPGDPEDLPEKLGERETPSGRRPVDETAFEGGFPDR